MLQRSNTNDPSRKGSNEDKKEAKPFLATIDEMVWAREWTWETFGHILRSFLYQPGR